MNNKQRLFEVMNRLNPEIKKLNEQDETIDETNNFFEISVPLNTGDFTLFKGIIDQGIDSNLQGFTKSNFDVKKNSLGQRLVMSFHKSELPILFRRLENIGTDEALDWIENIENYDENESY